MAGWLLGYSSGGTRKDEEEGGRGRKKATLVTLVWVFWGRKGCGWWKGGAALGEAGWTGPRLVWGVSGVAVLRRVGEVRGQLGTEGCTGLVGL